MTPHHYPHLQQILNTGTQVSPPPIPLPGSGSAPLSPWAGAAPQIGLLPHCPPTSFTLHQAPFLKQLCLTLAGTGVGERSRGQCWPIEIV